jgi:hypothetical protein
MTQEVSSWNSHKSYRRRKREVPAERLSKREQAAVSRIVERIRETFHAACPPSHLAQSNLEVAYHSITIDFECGYCGEGQHLKIPKADPKARDIVEVSSDAFSRRAARREFEALKWRQEFSRPLGEEFGAVEPLACWEDLSAVVTRRLRGLDLYEVCRQDARPWRRYLTSDVAKLLQGCGAWLGLLHSRTARPAPATCSPQSILEALQPNLELLAQWGLPLSLAENFQARLSRLNLDLPCPVATCMSGFQVRNVFVTGGKLIFLDPEDLAEGHTLQNVASFLVSLELLFWGTPWFLLPLPLRNQMREAFLEGYGANAPFDTRALWLWEIKQFVVYWKCAYRVLANKGYPRPVSFLVRKIYIDRFYSKAVMNRLEALVGQLPHQYE